MLKSLIVSSSLKRLEGRSPIVCLLLKVFVSKGFESSHFIIVWSECRRKVILITVGLCVHRFILTLTEVTVILTCRFQAIRFMFLFDCLYLIWPSIEQKVGILYPNQLQLKMSRINMKYTIWGFGLTYSWISSALGSWETQRIKFWWLKGTEDFLLSQHILQLTSSWSAPDS